MTLENWLDRNKNPKIGKTAGIFFDDTMCMFSTDSSYIENKKTDERYKNAFEDIIRRNLT